MAGKRDVQQQIAVLADDVDEKLNHGLGRPVPVVLVERPAVMPASDARVGLPWIGFDCARLAHFEVANQCA